ncbi:DUF2809 domain-containing protein [Xanthobacter autotrophicus]|uniref:ribosomal maturation YjgA family protein n=1 Tax=Xanthobacter autotrophicus TaxID=280 RepID=UPI00372A1FFB
MMATSSRRAFLLHIGAALIVMICGLVWRLVPMGLPGFFLNYGGGVLWGAMVLLIVGAILGKSERWWVTPLAAAAIALAAELFRLYHAPALDAFRTTLAGALLLGRIFNPWNIVAYWLGIVLALPLHFWIRKGQ